MRVTGLCGDTRKYIQGEFMNFIGAFGNIYAMIKLDSGHFTYCHYKTIKEERVSEENLMQKQIEFDEKSAARDAELDRQNKHLNSAKSSNWQDQICKDYLRDGSDGSRLGGFNVGGHPNI